MKKLSDIALCIAFILIITLPYLFAHRDTEERASDMENRMLAAYPLLYTDQGWNEDYISEYEDWLGDNLRGRTLLVEYQSALQYELFQRIVKEDTIEGKNHWLFYRNEAAFQGYQHLNLMSEQELDEAVESMQYLADYLEDREIAFYYFQCLDKEAIYGEEYVEGVEQYGEVTLADQFVERLVSDGDISVIYPKEELLTAAQNDLICFQYYDLKHWNEKGAYIGYRTVMERIAEDFPILKLLDTEDYDISEQQQITELYGYTYPYTETVPVYKIKNPQAEEMTAENAERWEYLHLKEHTHYYKNAETDSNLKILLAGDSYIRMFLKDDIAESFAETLSVDWANISVINRLVEEYQPDIVILESTDSCLGAVIESVNGIRTDGWG